jgi:hypothetical protein
MLMELEIFKEIIILEKMVIVLASWRKELPNWNKKSKFWKIMKILSGGKEELGGRLNKLINNFKYYI